MSSPLPPPGTQHRVESPTRAGTAAHHPSTASTDALIGQLTRLVRDEVRLAQAEVTQKAKKLGVGMGLFGGAGVLALLGVGALVTTVILALALVLPGRLAGLTVAAAFTLGAGVLALLGNKDVQQAAPRPLPTETLVSVQADIGAVKLGIA